MAEQTPSEAAGRTLLVRQALDLLNDVHPEDLSIREVARRAGLSSGAPYHHFNTKADLLAACAVLAWTDLCEKLEAGGSGDAAERLTKQVAAYLRFARKNPGPYQLITSRQLDADRRSGEIEQLRARAMSGVTASIIAATEPALDPAAAKLRGIALWSMLHGHLALNVDPADLAGTTPRSDKAIARLATRMALLPNDPE